MHNCLHNCLAARKGEAAHEHGTVLIAGLKFHGDGLSAVAKSKTDSPIPVFSTRVPNLWCLDCKKPSARATVNESAVFVAGHLRC